jgi:hypothetical protein
VTDKARITVMAALLMRGRVRVGHQHVKSSPAGIIAGSGASGAAADNDEVVLHGLFRFFALLAG